MPFLAAQSSSELSPSGPGLFISSFITYPALHFLPPPLHYKLLMCVCVLGWGESQRDMEEKGPGT